MVSRQFLLVFLFVIANLLISCDPSKPGNSAGYESDSDQCSTALVKDMNLIYSTLGEINRDFFKYKTSIWRFGARDPNEIKKTIEDLLGDVANFGTKYRDVVCKYRNEPLEVKAFVKSETSRLNALDGELDSNTKLAICDGVMLSEMDLLVKEKQGIINDMTTYEKDKVDDRLLGNIRERTDDYSDRLDAFEKIYKDVVCYYYHPSNLHLVSQEIKSEKEILESINRRVNELEQNSLSKKAGQTSTGSIAGSN